MDNDKNLDFEEDIDTDGEPAQESPHTAPRARNRTVMLTPEITGEVRARIAKDLKPDRPAPAAGGESASAAPGNQFFGGMYNARSQGTPERDGERNPSYSPAPRPQPSPGVSPAADPGVPPPASYSTGRFNTINEQIAAPRPQRAAAPASFAEPAAATGDSIVWSKESPVVGFLISYDINKNGDVFFLRMGRLIVTSEAAGAGNYLFLNHPSVSPMHAILRVNKGGVIQVLDQLSEHGTKICRFGSGEEEQLSGDKSSLEHGDVVMFGERKFHVCTIAADTES